MIRLCEKKDEENMYRIINDAAKAYQGVIPERQIETSVVLRRTYSRKP